MKSHELFEQITSLLSEGLLSGHEVVQVNAEIQTLRRNVKSPAEHAEESKQDEMREAALGERLHCEPDQARIEVLWEALAGRLDAMNGRLRSSQILVKSLRTSRVEASSIATDDGALLLVDPAYHDLALAHLQLAISCTDMSWITSIWQGVSIPEPILDRALAGMAGHSVMGHLRRTGQVGLHFGIEPQPPLLELTISVIEHLEMFVLAHEAAHCTLPGHLDSSPRAPGVTERETEWRLEFEADRQAAAVLLFDEQGAAASNLQLFVVTMAARLAFFTLDLAVHHHLFFGKESHPPGYVRYERFITAAFGIYSHPVVGWVERVLGPYEEEYARTLQGDSPMELGLGQKLAESGRLYLLGDSTLEQIDAEAFWGWVSGRDGAEVLTAWGVRNFASFCPSYRREADVPDLGVELPRVRELVANEVQAFQVLGEAWFREKYWGSVSRMNFWTQATPIFSGVLEELQTLFDASDPCMFEAATVLQLYRAMDGAHAVPQSLLTDERAVRLASEILKGHGSRLQ